MSSYSSFFKFELRYSVQLFYFVGTLCNAFVEKLIDSVLQLSDITLDTASQLTNVFTIVQDKIPELFHVSI